MYIVDLKKNIKNLEDEYSTLFHERRKTATYSYTLQEKSSGNIIVPSRTFEQYTLELAILASKIASLKNTLRKINDTICGNGLSISNNLIVLKQLSEEYNALKYFETNDPVERRLNSSGKEIEYTETNFNVGWLKTQIQTIKLEINKMQDAIDRTNLVTEVDYS